MFRKQQSKLYIVLKVAAGELERKTVASALASFGAYYSALSQDLQTSGNMFWIDLKKNYLKDLVAAISL
tara:strand:+ start:214 stop:420 length:207 start_codon:yes stop_codon:yes gene_type:complete